MIEFNRDIRPILADTCYACHGPDGKRQADLRLRDGRSVAGAKASLCPARRPRANYGRVSTNPDEMMPPPQFQAARPTSDRRTAPPMDRGGCEVGGPLGLLPIPPAPAAGGKRVCLGRNPIDCFILPRSRNTDLGLRRMADPRTLLRRLRFDLIGLPPSTGRRRCLHRRSSDRARTSRLSIGCWLRRSSASGWPCGGSTWFAMPTASAITAISRSSVYPFRDYVIKSFNDNKPFDRFTLEQLAGDLLPEPTIEDKVASGYNRLGMMSAEGGVQPKEYLSKYIAERVRNVSGAWLGVTFGCCECHNHKYDPFTQQRLLFAGGVFRRHRRARTLLQGPTMTGAGGRASSCRRRPKSASDNAWRARSRLNGRSSKPHLPAMQPSRPNTKPPSPSAEQTGGARGRVEAARVADSQHADDGFDYAAYDSRAGPRQLDG